MGDFRSGWREKIDENLEVLSKCTIITPKMITLLLNHKLITPNQKDNLVNPSNLNHKPAITLYIRIAKQWTDLDFEKFELVLHESRNTLTLKILTQDSMPKKEISELAACYNFASKVDNQIEETTRQEETEAEDISSKKETKLLTKTFPGVSKPSDMNELSGVNETHLLSEVRQLKDNCTTEEFKLKNLETKFEELQKSSTEELLLKTKEADELRTLLNKLESETAIKISSLEKNCKCFEQDHTQNVVSNNQARAQVDEKTVSIETQLWTLEDRPKFEIEKALGNWFLIEMYERNNLLCINWNSMKITFARIGDIIKCTQSPLYNVKTTNNFEMTAAPQTPHIWNLKSNYNIIWIKTDYCNYAIIVYASDSSIASSNPLYIISRTQSLPPETLEMLRNVAVKFGFPKTNGELLRHSSLGT